MLRAAVSGSFHRHIMPIYQAVAELRAHGVDVLSPSDPRVVDNIGEFLFVASDRLRSVKLVQDRHLDAIRASHFLWVVCPDGYTGPSTCLEIGTARALGVPVYSTSAALDITIGEYVEHVSGYADAIARAQARAIPAREAPSVLVAPETAIESAHEVLTALGPALTGRVGDRSKDAELALVRTRRVLGAAFGVR